MSNQLQGSIFGPSGSWHMNPNYTPPRQQVTYTNQQQDNAGPLGLSSSDTGSIASKFINTSFSDKVGKFTNFLDNGVGTKLGFGTSPVTAGALPGAATAPQIVGNAAGLTGAEATFANSAASSAGFGNMSGVANAAGAMDTPAVAAQPGFLGTTSTLSEVLGSAGIGAGIGMALEKFNVIGGNPTNAMFGGALGGAAGSALMGSTLGSAIGSLIPIPGLGTIAGGALGSWVGSMFGSQSPPTNAEGGGGMMNPNGSVGYHLGGQKNAGPIGGFTSEATRSFSDIAQAANKKLGISFSPDINFGSGISTKHPGPGGRAAVEITNKKNNFDTGKIFYNDQDPESTKNAMYQALKAAATQSGYTDEAALKAFYDSYSPQQQSGFEMPGMPTVTLNTTSFADFMAKTKGTNNGNGTPNI